MISTECDLRLQLSSVSLFQGKYLLFGVKSHPISIFLNICFHKCLIVACTKVILLLDFLVIRTETEVTGLNSYFFPHTACCLCQSWRIVFKYTFPCKCAFNVIKIYFLFIHKVSLFGLFEKAYFRVKVNSPFHV